MNRRFQWAGILLALFSTMCSVPPASSRKEAGRGGFRLPPYKKVVLDNGLTLFLMEQHEVPLITVSATVPAGADRDGERFGLASLTADGLLFGTKSYPKERMEELLDFLGASYGAAASKESAEVTLSFMAKDQDKIFPVFKEILVHPVFDGKEFEKRKTRLLVQLELARERPSAVIWSYFNKFLFGSHKYGNPVPGVRPVVSELTVDDLKDFYREHYAPEGAAIAVVGDFQTREMEKQLEALFSDWQGGRKKAVEKSEPLPALPHSRVLLVNKSDATETRFIIGGFGIKRSNPDYVAVQVVNTILGGRFTSWLNDELRVNAGLTYGAFSTFGAYKDSGIFGMASFTRTAKTVEAIDLALEVLDRLHTKGIDEKTLASAKNYINGQFPPRYETAGSLASLLTSMFVYGFDESFINEFQQKVSSMTVEKAREIVKAYFPKENLQFVLIGKAEAIRDKVKEYGALTEKEIKAEGF